MKASESRYNHCIYFSSNAFARKIEKLASECWKKIGLPPSHAYVLMTVLEEPGIQPGRVAEELQLSPSTVTRLIEKLEEKDLVTRSFGAKTTNIFPTSRAQKLEPQMKQCSEQFRIQYSSILGTDESCQLIRSINSINDQLP